MEGASSKLFDQPGYISLGEYVDDIDNARKNGPWRLPLSIGDRIHLLFLSAIVRFSWFSETLRIAYPHEWSPAYSILLSYLKKRGFFDEIKEVDTHQSGYFSYFIKKNILINNYNYVVSGQGTGPNKAVAMSKAMGEIVERMVSGVLDMNKDRIVASPDQLLKEYQALYPPKSHRFLEIQKQSYRELHRDPTHPIEWVAGINLVTQGKTYIPRQMTSWFEGGRNFKEKLLDSTSNGCAGYFTKTGAVLRGLLEVVHRDAFLVHWLTMIAPDAILPNTLPEEMQKTVREFASRGIVLSILDVTALSIPSVYIVAINTDSGTPRVVLSGAAAVSMHQAIHDALEEMIAVSGVFYESRDWSKWEDKLKAVLPFISDINKTTRQLYWRGKDRIEQFEWFISGEDISYDEACKQNIASEGDDLHRLQACVVSLKKRGNDFYPIVYRPAHPVQEELGFYVAQVFIPRAFPLYLEEYCGTFDSERLREFALSKNVSEWRLNPLPHMFS